MINFKVGFNYLGYAILFSFTVFLKTVLTNKQSFLTDNRRRIGNMRRRGIVANGRGSLPISSLVAGRLDKHGNFTLVAGAGGNQKSSATTKYSFAEDIRRLKSGAG